MFEAEFWVLVSFLIFVGLIVYLKVPAMVASALDQRAARIARELEEARKLRKEAQALLAEYEGKRKEASKLADDIVAQAKREAEAQAEDARRKLAEMVERRSKLAEQKIAQAEAQAVKEVRGAAADLAIAAASRIIAAQTKGPEASRLIDQSISQIKTKLH
jgi:F-type H+-transporting ATPase subunit b